MSVLLQLTELQVRVSRLERENLRLAQQLDEEQRLREGLEHQVQGRRLQGGNGLYQLVLTLQTGPLL